MLLLFIFTGTAAFPQFNTLTPVVPAKQEIQQKPEKDRALENPVKPRNLLNEVLGKGGRKGLKNEIDSLKILIKELNRTDKERNRRTDKLRDSLLSAVLAFNLKKNEKPAENFRPLYEPVSEPVKISSKIVMPLHSRIAITSPFGTRIHPIFGTQKMHNGIDLKASYENVYSVLDGVVSDTGWDPKGGGNYIKVRHYNRFETTYLHLSQIYYRVGETVKAGFAIGKSGNTGNSTGPHLHFAVKENGRFINPATFLNDLVNANNLTSIHYAK